MPPEEGGLINLSLAAKDMVELCFFSERITKTLRRLLESWKVARRDCSFFAGLAAVEIQLRRRMLPCVGKWSDHSLFDMRFRTGPKKASISAARASFLSIQAIIAN